MTEHTLTLTPAQATQLTHWLRQQDVAQMIAGTYLAALCDGASLGPAQFVRLTGHVLTVATPEAPAP